MNEICDFERKQAVLLEVRKRMNMGEPPTGELYEAYQRIPRDEVQAIFNLFDFFGAPSPLQPASKPKQKRQKTWAEVVMTK